MTIAVTPKQAIDLIKGKSRAVLTACDVPGIEPQTVLVTCPEIGWKATAYVEAIVRAEPRFLFALDTTKRVDAREIGTTRLRLMHLCNQCRGRKVTVFCLRRIDEWKEES